jgi:hypothetical protein
MDSFAILGQANAGIFGQRFLPDLDIEDYYIPLFNDGTLNRKDICVNYAKIQAAVIMVLRKNNQMIIPLFTDVNMGKDFSKRNMPGKIYGSTSLSKKFLNANLGKYIFELLGFPKKINLSLGFEICGEIMDHDEKITFLYH